MNEISIFQWVLLSFGGGIIVTMATAFIFLGRKIQELGDLKGQLKELQDDTVLREYCKERHGVIDKRFSTGENKFTELAKFVIEIKEMVARIDERTAKWQKT